MFSDLLINDQTRSAIQSFLNSPSHALILVGPEGSGKAALAARIAAELLQTDRDKLSTYPYFLRVERPEGKRDIPIESIRAVSKLLSLKVPGSKTISRLVLIEDAQDMNSQAQNALLKSLEEPPAGTIIILTADSAGNVLPTIASRAQKIIVHPVSMQDALKFYANSPAADNVSSAWQLSQGSPSLLNAIVTDQEPQLKTAIDQAKQIFTMTKYQKLIEFDKLSKDKRQLAAVLDAMARVSKALLRQSVAKDKPGQTKQLLLASRLILDAQKSLEASVSPKLVGLKLVLNLPL